MLTKVINPPFNAGRLHKSLGVLLGDYKWTFKLGGDARTIEMEVEDSLCLSLKPGNDIPGAQSKVSDDIDVVVAYHQANFDVDELVQMKERSALQIDSKAGEVSRRYVTERTAQEITYQLKLSSSTLWVANGKPLTIDRITYPGLYAEVMAFRSADPSATIQSVVDYITATAGAWYYKADQIEEQRRIGKIRVAAATTQIQVVDILTQTINSLSAL